MTLRTVLLSLQALLSAAEPDDPQDAVVAKQYKDAPDMFRLTARHWTAAYAGGNFFSAKILFITLLQFAILFEYLLVNLAPDILKSAPYFLISMNNYHLFQVHIVTQSLIPKSDALPIWELKVMMQELLFLHSTGTSSGQQNSCSASCCLPRYFRRYDKKLCS